MKTDLRPTRARAVLALGLAAALVAGCDETLATGSSDRVTGEMRREYLVAASTVGCVLRDERQYGAVEFQAGLTREQTVQITEYYLRRGQAERVPEDPSAVRLTSGPCADTVSREGIRL